MTITYDNALEILQELGEFLDDHDRLINIVANSVCQKNSKWMGDSNCNAE